MFGSRGILDEEKCVEVKMKRTRACTRERTRKLIH